jgi:TRAP-type mannitol/chloroaromatic compound transport system permease large subunit
MFVLMGEFLFISGISDELFTTFRHWFGKLRGGLAMATIGAVLIMFGLAYSQSRDAHVAIDLLVDRFPFTYFTIIFRCSPKPILKIAKNYTCILQFLDFIF